VFKDDSVLTFVIYKLCLNHTVISRVREKKNVKGLTSFCHFQFCVGFRENGLLWHTMNLASKNAQNGLPLVLCNLKAFFGLDVLPLSKV